MEIRDLPDVARDAKRYGIRDRMVWDNTASVYYRPDRGDFWEMPGARERELKQALADVRAQDVSVSSYVNWRLLCESNSTWDRLKPLVQESVFGVGLFGFPCGTLDGALWGDPGYEMGSHAVCCGADGYRAYANPVLERTLALGFDAISVDRAAEWNYCADWSRAWQAQVAGSVLPSRQGPAPHREGWPKMLLLRAMTMVFCVVSASVWAEIGLVTWLQPQADGRLATQSACPGVAVSLRAADGTLVSDAAGLAAAGWHGVDGGLWETPKRAGGGKLLITVTGLPAGTHQVFLRYFAQARLAGNPWWFALQAGLEGGNTTRGWLDQNADRIVSGTGGHDPTTLYETLVGTVGGEEEPVGQISLWVQRYEWSELARIGAIRIETDPSMHSRTTDAATPANDRVRTALLANGPQADGKPAYGVAVVSGTLKVRPKGFAELRGQELLAQVDLAAARGEYESRQIVLYSPDRDLAGVTLQCSALTGGNGQVIPVDELLFAPVGYCPYRVPSNLSIHGYWPEPILTFLKEFSVRRGDVQSLWYRVHVPRGTTPGTYRGTVRISAKDAPACTLPVVLRVWDFALPLMPRLRVVVGCNRVGAFEMSYGLNPSTIYGFDEKWIGEMPAWAAAGATAINLGYIWSKDLDPQSKLPTAAQLDDWVAQIGKRYQAATAAGLRDACYVYLFDEATAEWDPALRLISRRLRQEFPGLLLLTTAHRAWSPGAAVKDGGDTIEDIGGWCPTIDHYDLGAAAEARRHGRQVWWYTCNSPEKPFPNLLMTHPAMDARLLLGFMALACRTDGYLYYATAGGTYDSMPAISEGPYTNWAILDNAHNHLYQKGPDGPLPSLRLEAMRDGLEDYDYLYLAEACSRDLQTAGTASPQLAALAGEISPYFAPGNGLVGSLTSYSEDPAALETVRRKLGEYVELAQQVLGRPVR